MNFVGEYTYTVTEEGLSRISKDGVTFGQGGLYLWDGKTFHGLNSSQSFYSEPLNLTKSYPLSSFYEQVKSNIVSKSIVETADSAVVTHQYDDIRVDYTYTHNDGLNVRVKITNDSTGQITCPVVGGLNLTYPTNPSGLGYRFAPADTLKLHPSPNTPTYCGYLEDDTYGISITLLNQQHVRNLAHFDYYTDPKERTLEYHLRKFVYPKNVLTYDLNIKAGRGTGVLSAYKTDLLTQYGQRNYPIGNRKFIFNTSIASGGSPNPYALVKRLDTANGTISFANEVKNLSGCRGVVVNDFCGYSSRGPLPYEMWPQPVEENVWEFNNQLASGNREAGLRSEFHQQPVRVSWTQDDFISLWPLQEYTPDLLSQASNWNLIDYKFKRVNDFDFNMYYNPEGGASYESVLLVDKLRPLNTGCSIYYGYPCDTIASKVGFSVKSTNGQVRHPEFYPIMRWVHGDIDVYCEPSGNITLSCQTALGNRMSLWITNSGHVPTIFPIQTGFINTLTGQFS